VHAVGVAKLLMEDTREGRLPLLVLARGCPEGLTAGQSYVFTGTLCMRAERDDNGRLIIVPELTVETAGPPSQVSPWARLQAEGRVEKVACRETGPVKDADEQVLLASYTAFLVGLPTHDGRWCPLQVLHEAEPLPLPFYQQDPASGTTVMIGERPTLARALGRDEPDALSARMLALHKGDRVRLDGDLSLLERMPDDEPGADLQLQVTDLARVG
jgi:hypothetical protein